jgi:sortase A
MIRIAANMQNRVSTFLLLSGGAVLVWCVCVWTGAALFERWEAHQWSAPPSQTATAAPSVRAAPRPHDVIAWLEIPRLGVATSVLEGDDDTSLRLGAGHIPGTPRPGEAGNIGIAAHRDTFFRPLSRIRAQDRIRLRTPQGDREYVVESTHIVRPSSVKVLDDLGYGELTLVTCYPFQYFGSAPLRFVVHARQSD